MWVWARLCTLKNECTRLAAASDKVCHLLVYGRLFSPGIPTSSTTKTGRHDIAEILLKVALNTKNQIKSVQTQWLLISCIVNGVRSGWIHGRIAKSLVLLSGVVRLVMQTEQNLGLILEAN